MCFQRCWFNWLLVGFVRYLCNVSSLLSGNFLRVGCLGGGGMAEDRRTPWCCSRIFLKRIRFSLSIRCWSSLSTDVCLRCFLRMFEAVLPLSPVTLRWRRWGEPKKPGCEGSPKKLTKCYSLITESKWIKVSRYDIFLIISVLILILKLF